MECILRTKHLHFGRIEPQDMQKFTFNRPVTLLFAAPLFILILMFGYGLSVEFRVSLLIMLMISLGLTSLLVYLGIFRSLQIGEGKAIWSTPRIRYEMKLSEVRHVGIVKFRSFRFIYFSRASEQPFEDPNAAVLSDENTFVIQYREKAWESIKSAIAALHPEIRPKSVIRQ